MDVRVEPPVLAAVRAEVRDHIPEVTDAIDRRGFRLMHWPAQRGEAKRIELSLEHEARLRPSYPAALAELLPALYMSEGRSLAEMLLPGSHSFSAFVIRQFERKPGPQSSDVYYDTVGETERGGLAARLITVRKRLVGSGFMTWDSSSHTRRPLNLELPFVEVDPVGVQARLEFNWMDDLDASIVSATGGSGERARIENPLYIAAQNASVAVADLRPAVQHATVRHKFSISEPDKDGEPGAEAFAFNVDFARCQSLQSGRKAAHVHIDISSVRVIDGHEIARLIEFTRLWTSAFSLERSRYTNLLRDYEYLGVLPPDVDAPQIVYGAEGHAV